MHHVVQCDLVRKLNAPMSVSHKASLICFSAISAALCSACKLLVSGSWAGLTSNSMRQRATAAGRYSREMLWSGLLFGRADMACPHAAAPIARQGLQLHCCLAGGTCVCRKLHSAGALPGDPHRRKFLSRRWSRPSEDSAWQFS